MHGVPDTQPPPSRSSRPAWNPHSRSPSRPCSSWPGPATRRLSKVALLGIAENVVKNIDPGRTQIEVKGAADVIGWANPLLLEQIVVNLVRNAIDATRDCPDPAILVRVYATGTEARISVRDNGPGIPAALRERIFEPFVTTNGAAGTGLGLALARHATARMGGTLTLGASEKGAVFRVRLRRGEAGARASTVRSNAQDSGCPHASDRALAAAGRLTRRARAFMRRAMRRSMPHRVDRW